MQSTNKQDFWDLLAAMADAIYHLKIPPSLVANLYIVYREDGNFPP